MDNKLTPEEIERMRTLVVQYDSANNKKTFDLNHPERTPGIIPPYSYREYPKVMYAADGSTVRVFSAGEAEEAEAKGMKDKPFPAAASSEPAPAAEPKVKKRPRGRRYEIPSNPPAEEKSDE